MVVSRELSEVIKTSNLNEKFKVLLLNIYENIYHDERVQTYCDIKSVPQKSLTILSDFT